MSLQAQAFAFLFPGSAMVNSLLATAYISIFPNLLLYFVPPNINTDALNVLVSFAVGGLLGDVFLHLLPHAFLGEHEEGHSHSHSAVVEIDNKKNVLIGLGIFGGFFFFFVMDKMMRVLNGGGGHDHGHGHSHSHSHHHKEEDNKKGSDKDSQQHVEHEGLRQRKGTKEQDNDKEEDKEEKEKGHQQDSSIKLSAYLNLFADFTHNMTDGLAMAASFYASPAVGATTAVAVFFHEIPHEVGDYAILIQSGFSKQRAMLAQFTTAIGAFLGTFIGIFIQEASLVSSSSSHIEKDHIGLFGTDLHWGDLVIPFTAGGFLYIATVGVVPELLNVSGKVQKDKRQAFAEFTSMLVGLGLMTMIAWNEV